MTADGPHGVQTALRFLRHARTDPLLRERLAQLRPEDGLEPVLRVAGEHGFVLGEDELRAAYAQDWGLRRMRFHAETSSPPAPPRPSPS